MAPDQKAGVDRFFCNRDVGHRVACETTPTGAQTHAAKRIRYPLIQGARPQLPRRGLADHHRRDGARLRC